MPRASFSRLLNLGSGGSPCYVSVLTPAFIPRSFEMQLKLYTHALRLEMIGHYRQSSKAASDIAIEPILNAGTRARRLLRAKCHVSRATAVFLGEDLVGGMASIGHYAIMLHFC